MVVQDISYLVEVPNGISYYYPEGTAFRTSLSCLNYIHW